MTILPLVRGEEVGPSRYSTCNYILASVLLVFELLTANIAQLFCKFALSFPEINQASLAQSGRIMLHLYLKIAAVLVFTMNASLGMWSEAAVKALLFVMLLIYFASDL